MADIIVMTDRSPPPQHPFIAQVSYKTTQALGLQPANPIGWGAALRFPFPLAIAEILPSERQTLRKVQLLLWLGSGTIALCPTVGPSHSQGRRVNSGKDAVRRATARPRTPGSAVCWGQLRLCLLALPPAPFKPTGKAANVTFCWLPPVQAPVHS